MLSAAQVHQPKKSRKSPHPPHSKVYAARGLYKGLKKSDKLATKISPSYVEKSIGGDKNGGKRLVPNTKAPRFYPAKDVRQPKKSHKSPPILPANKSMLLMDSTRASKNQISLPPKYHLRYVLE
jgi:hypothetical protein